MGASGGPKKRQETAKNGGEVGNPKMERKRDQNGAQKEPKWTQNGAQKGPKWSQNGGKID